MRIDNDGFDERFNRTERAVKRIGIVTVIGSFLLFTLIITAGVVGIYLALKNWG